jgi:hypothetical protein
MNIAETTRLLAFIQGAYPGRFEATKDTIRVWHEMLGDQDFEGVYRRAQRHITKSPHPPAISDLKLNLHGDYRVVKGAGR